MVIRLRSGATHRMPLTKADGGEPGSLSPCCDCAPCVGNPLPQDLAQVVDELIQEVLQTDLQEVGAAGAAFAATALG